MAQSVKVRKALKGNGSLRRKTPAPKTETCPKCPEEFLRGHLAASDHFIEYIERNKAAREMIAPDIGCLNWQTNNGRGGYLRIIRRPEPAKPSLLSRLKAWWPL